MTDTVQKKINDFLCELVDDYLCEVVCQELPEDYRYILSEEKCEGWWSSVENAVNLLIEKKFKDAESFLDEYGAEMAEYLIEEEKQKEQEGE